MNELNTPRINQKRLWRDLEELGRIGAQGEKGLFRPALSPADLEGKAWFKAKLLEAGLEFGEDSVYNQTGRLPGPPRDKTIALGSHLDTVPGGGRFDGALGVLAALECARVLAEQGTALRHNLEVINFCDEEGAHGIGTVGSRTMLGLLEAGDLETCGFSQSLDRAGKDPRQAGSDARRPGEFAAYLELHIEQGRVLEERGIEIGAVSAIVGIRRYWVTVRGESGHAGTTPMQMRKDALVEAAPFFSLLPGWAMEQNPDMVATIGRLVLEPGAANVIPGSCSFMVELRSPKQEDLSDLGQRIQKYAGQRQGWVLEQVYDTAPAALTEDLIQMVEQAAKIEGFPCGRISSGAGHDAHSFAVAGVPSGMIFIPCARGLSHCPEEAISPEQAARGCQVLLNMVLALGRA